MPTETEIANDALSIIGAAPLINISDTTNEAFLCRTYLAPARRYVLRRKPWKCAIRFDTPAPLSGSTPAPGFTYVFDFPSNCLKLVKVDTYECEFRVFGNQFHTNTDSPKIEFIKDVAWGEIDDGCASVIAAYLATLIAPRLTNSPDLSAQAHQIYEKRKRDASFDDSGSEITKNDTYSGWIESRGSFRNFDPMT